MIDPVADGNRSSSCWSSKFDSTVRRAFEGGAMGGGWRGCGVGRDDVIVRSQADDDDNDALDCSPLLPLRRMRGKTKTEPPELHFPLIDLPTPTQSNDKKQFEETHNGNDMWCQVDVHWSSGPTNRAFYLLASGLGNNTAAARAA